MAKKKVLALLLAVSMILGLLPLYGFADPAQVELDPSSAYDVIDELVKPAAEDETGISIEEAKQEVDQIVEDAKADIVEIVDAAGDGFSEVVDDHNVTIDKESADLTQEVAEKAETVKEAQAAIDEAAQEVEDQLDEAARQQAIAQDPSSSLSEKHQAAAAAAEAARAAAEAASAMQGNLDAANRAVSEAEAAVAKAQEEYARLVEESQGKLDAIEGEAQEKLDQVQKDLEAAQKALDAAKIAKERAEDAQKKAQTELGIADATADLAAKAAEKVSEATKDAQKAADDAKEKADEAKAAQEEADRLSAIVDEKVIAAQAAAEAVEAAKAKADEATAAAERAQIDCAAARADYEKAKKNGVSDAELASLKADWERAEKKANETQAALERLEEDLKLCQDVLIEAGNAANKANSELNSFLAENGKESVDQIRQEAIDANTRLAEASEKVSMETAEALKNLEQDKKAQEELKKTVDNAADTKTELDHLDIDLKKAQEEEEETKKAADLEGKAQAVTEAQKKVDELDSKIAGLKDFEGKNPISVTDEEREQLKKTQEEIEAQQAILADAQKNTAALEIAKSAAAADVNTQAGRTAQSMEAYKEQLKNQYGILYWGSSEWGSVAEMDRQMEILNDPDQTIEARQAAYQNIRDIMVEVRHNYPLHRNEEVYNDIMTDLAGFNSRVEKQKEAEKAVNDNAQAINDADARLKELNDDEFKALSQKIADADGIDALMQAKGEKASADVDLAKAKSDLAMSELLIEDARKATEEAVKAVEKAQKKYDELMAQVKDKIQNIGDASPADLKALMEAQAALNAALELKNRAEENERNAKVQTEKARSAAAMYDEVYADVNQARTDLANDVTSAASAGREYEEAQRKNQAAQDEVDRLRIAAEEASRRAQEAEDTAKDLREKADQSETARKTADAAQAEAKRLFEEAEAAQAAAQKLADQAAETLASEEARLAAMQAAEESLKAALAAQETYEALEQAAQAAKELVTEAKRAVNSAHMQATSDLKSKEGQEALRTAQANLDLALAQQAAAQQAADEARRAARDAQRAADAAADEARRAQTAADEANRFLDDLLTPAADGQTEIDENAVPLASGPITRAEFVDYLWRHEGSPEATAISFADVADDHEYAPAIDWARSIGLVTGDRYGNFYPDDLVTVETVRSILTRYAAYLGMAMPELTTLTGGTGEAVLNCDQVCAEFFGEEYSIPEDLAA